MAVSADAAQQAKLAQLFEHPTMEGMLALEWAAFEDFVKYVFESAGYAVEKVSSRPKHNVDLVLYAGHVGSRVLARVEVRRYRTANIIRARVHQFHGALLQKGPAPGYIITTSDFTKPAYDAAEATHGKVHLINGQRLLRYIRYVAGSRVTGDDMETSSLQQALISPHLLFEAERIPRLDAHKTTVLAVANNKGGVAKTTTSQNLAFALAAKRHERVLLVDMDAQGSLTAALTEESASFPSLLDHFTHQQPLSALVHATLFEGVWVIRSDDRLFRLNVSGEQWQLLELSFVRALHDGSLVAPDQKPFDWIIIDTPPAQSHFTRIALAASHYVLLPATPETQAVLGLNKALTTAKTMQALMRDGVQVLGGVVARWKKTVPAEQALASMTQILHAHGSKVYATRIPEDAQIERANLKTYNHKRVNIFNLTRKEGAAAEAYENLMQEVLVDVHRD